MPSDDDKDDRIPEVARLDRYTEATRKRGGACRAAVEDRHIVNAADAAKLAYQDELEVAVCVLVYEHGMTQREAAKEVGIPLSQVNFYLHRAHRYARKQNVERVERQVAQLNAKLDLEEEDLRELIEKYRDAALGGDMDAANVVIRAQHTLTAKHAVRLRANGLEAPQRHELTGPKGAPIVVSVADIEQALQAAASNLDATVAEHVDAGSGESNRPRLQ